jgi:hypothetical protein
MRLNHTAMKKDLLYLQRNTFSAAVIAAVIRAVTVRMNISM